MGAPQLFPQIPHLLAEIFFYGGLVGLLGTIIYAIVSKLGLNLSILSFIPFGKIPLTRAAQIFHDKARGGKGWKTIDGLKHDPNSKLEFYMRELLVGRVYGKKLPSGVCDVIENAKDYWLSPTLQDNSLTPPAQNYPDYIDVCIARSDLNKAIKDFRKKDES